MKTLQNNFTTPEQSKKLLKLGVPADSADCYRFHEPHGNMVNENAKEIPDGFSYSEYMAELCRRGFSIAHYLPCWSVGRLIEIHETCTSCLFARRFPQLSVLEDVLAQIAEDIIATDECWDFSKLED